MRTDASGAIGARVSPPPAAQRLPGLPPGVERSQQRLASFERATVNTDARTIELAFSSEAPVERWWGTEILGHAAGEIDTSFIGSGTAPLLMDHNARDLVGVVQSVTLGADRKMRAVVRFGKSARATEVLADVQDGLRSNVSVGYELSELRLISEEKGKPPVYRCHWKPFEVSLVAIPADLTVGVGRDGKPIPPAHPKRETTMLNDMPEPHRAASSPAMPRDYAQRDAVRREIMDLAELGEMREAGVTAIARGLSVEQFRAEMMTARASKPLGLSHAMGEGQQGDRHLDHALRGFNLVRAIAGQVPGLNVDWGHERELSQEIARRAGRAFQGIAVPMAVFQQPLGQRTLTTTSPGGGPGGNLVQTDLHGNEFIDMLRQALVVRALGARVLAGLRGNVDLPRQNGSATSGWVAENAALSTSDLSFDKVSLTPKHAGCITELSRNMLLQPSLDVEQLVREDFAKLLAATLDTAAIAGTGTSNQPTGILNVAGIGNVAMGTNGGALSYDAVADLVGQVADSNAELGRLGIMTNTKVRRAAAKLKDNVDRPYGLDSVFQGMPHAFSNVVPSTLTKGTSAGNCSAMVYGNWNDLLLGYWSEIDVLVNPFESAAYSKGNIQVRAMMTVDIAVRHPESFAAIKDILA